LTNRVITPGFVQYPELPTYYGLAEAFVLPSTTEQWGLVVNEAMAAGLPVLVSNRCGCAADLVHEGRNGYTFDPYDVDELAGLLVRISSDDCSRKAMGEAGKEIISSWSPDTFAKSLWRAAELARASALAKPGVFDRLLLRLLIQRRYGSAES
jgi:glycosyltransferase involved in cell wall biosynthesis